MAKCSVCLCLMLAILALAKYEKQVLYGVKDKIALVNSKNFNSVILGKNNAWLIQFYKHTCGHCIGMAPWWKMMAHAVKEWANVIALAVLDCDDNQNLEICVKYDFTSSPTLKFFPPKLKSKDKGEDWEGDREIDLVANAMLDFAVNQSKHAPSSWPKLDAVRYPDLKSLWASTKSKLDWVAVIVETAASHLGVDIILTAQHLKKYVRITRAVQGQATFINSVQKKKIPYMIVAKRGGKPYTFRGPGEVQMREPYILHLEGIARKHKNWKGKPPRRGIIDRKLTKKRLEKLNKYGKLFNNGSSATAKKVRGYPLHTVFLQDFDNAIRQMLWREVGMHKKFTKAQKSIVSTFFTLVYKVMPLKKETKGFLKHFTKWLIKKKSITRFALVSNLQDFAKGDKFDKDVQPYIGCQGSKPMYRGHPCSLWITFHALTVGAYLKNKNNPKWNKLEYLNAIRNYVINYFSCNECAKNFAKESAKMKKEVKTPKDSVLWLWETHNRVNKRLKGATAEDPMHPKIQFPPKKLCKKCRVSTNGEKIKWNRKFVLPFLIKMYSKKVVRKKIGPRDMIPMRKKPKKKQNSRSGNTSGY